MIWASRDGESARNQSAQGSGLIEPMAIKDDVVVDGIGGYAQRFLVLVRRRAGRQDQRCRWQSWSA
jgi:hypothetical protein